MSKHVGRPIVRLSASGKRVLVLCPRGHLYLSVSVSDWSGSNIEARCGNPHFTVRCEGTYEVKDVSEFDWSSRSGPGAPEWPSPLNPIPGPPEE